MAEIVDRLHNLTGATLGEIFRSLNLLIKSHGEAIKNNLDFILSNFEPCNQLEQLTKIRLIDQYQCYDEMLNVLKTDDSFYISHVLQCSWFFNNVSFDADALVNSVLPSVSYSTRTKLLKRYSKFLKNPAAADSLFGLLKQRYGLNTAVMVLPACSKNFIECVLENSSLQIPLCILLPIFKLYPTVVISYILYLAEAHLKNKRFIRRIRLNNYEKLYSLIASKYPLKFAYLMENYHSAVPYLKLGKRSTRRLLQSSYDSFRDNATVYKRVIIWKNVSYSLNIEQLSMLQLALLPKTVHGFIHDPFALVDAMDVTMRLKNKEKKQSTLVNNFQKAYGKPITAYLDSLPFHMIKDLPRNAIESWIEQKLPSLDEITIRGEHAVYLPRDKSIPFLKKLLECQPNADVRSRLVECLFEVINVNDDPRLIQPLCEYVVKRFRNDRSYLKKRVIQYLCLNKHITKISEESWAPIDELMNFMILTGEASSCSGFGNLLGKRILFRYEKSLSVNEYLEKYMKFHGNDYKLDLGCGTPYEKTILEWFVDWLGKKATEMVSEMRCSLFHQLCQWNFKHPQDKIPLPEWILKHIEDVFNDENVYYYRKEQILKCVKKDKGMMAEFYEKIFPKHIDSHILSYKLRNDPLSIKNNYNTILTKIFTGGITIYRSFFMEARLYSPFGIPQSFSQHCLQILQDEDTYSHDKQRAVIVLSLMLPTQKYMEVVSNYYPQQDTLDDFSDAAKETYQIQTEIAHSFRDVTNPSLTLEALLKFAVGDYLKQVIGSMSSVFLRTSEQQILPLLSSWLDGPVSVRKHFIRAFFKIAPIKSTLQMLASLFEKEKNISLRLLFLENSLRFFFNEPCNETFSILSAIADRLEESDEDALKKKLFDIDNVPDEFLSAYFDILWNKISFKDKALTSKKRMQIIQLIEPEVLRLLNEELCDALIAHVFSEGTLPLCMNSFVSHYLLQSKDSGIQNKRLDKVVSRMKPLFGQWDQFNLKATYVFQSRKLLSSFIDTLVRLSLENDEKPLLPSELLVQIHSCLLNLTKEENVIEEILLLEVAKFFFTYPNNSEVMFHFANFIEPIVSKTTSLYGDGYIHTISSIIAKLFSWAYTEPQKKYLDLTEILLSKSSTHLQLLGIILLPIDIYSDINRYEKIIEAILLISDIRVTVYINKLLRDLSNTERMD